MVDGDIEHEFETHELVLVCFQVRGAKDLTPKTDFSTPVRDKVLSNHIARYYYFTSPAERRAVCLIRLICIREQAPHRGEAESCGSNQPEDKAVVAEEVLANSVTSCNQQRVGHDDRSIEQRRVRPGDEIPATGSHYRTRSVAERVLSHGLCASIFLPSAHTPQREHLLSARERCFFPHP